MTLPSPSGPAVVARMRRQKRTGTAPEIALRKELFRRGLRYRVNVAVLDRRRRHDIVFTKAKVVAEVRGCFWHGCREHRTIPKANSDWWTAKFAENRRRDEDTAQRLEQLGWTLIIVWEHDDVSESAERIEAFVRRASTRCIAH